jgi:hypothetical protein
MEEFMIQSDEMTPDRYDGRGETNRMDLTPFITRHSGLYPNPSGLILVADPVFVPDEVLKMLLAPNDDGIHPVILTDAEFEWSPSSWMGDLELRASTWEEMGHPFGHEMGHREWCAVCHAPVKNEGLAFYWAGKPICDDCPSATWKAVQRRGYEHAESAEKRYYGKDVGDRMEVWLEAIFEYADEIKERN